MASISSIISAPNKVGSRFDAPYWKPTRNINKKNKMVRKMLSGLLKAKYPTKNARQLIHTEYRPDAIYNVRSLNFFMRALMINIPTKVPTPVQIPKNKV